MKIEIDDMHPDGIMVNITGIALDTYEEAHEVIKLADAIRKHNKIDPEECLKLFKESVQRPRQSEMEED